MMKRTPLCSQNSSSSSSCTAAPQYNCGETSISKWVLISVFVVVSTVIAACGSATGSGAITERSAGDESAAGQATKPASAEPTPMPQDVNNQPFLMQIDNVFAIKGRGTVVTGRVARGRVQVGDEVEIIDSGDRMLKTVVTGVEMFQKTQDQAVAGDNVGILLRGIEADEAMPGMVLVQAGAFTSYAEALRDLE